MKKAYLFIYNDMVGDREELKNILNDMSTVITWRFDIPHCFYIISENSADEIYEEFFTKVGQKGRYMFIEASSNSQGQMLEDTWYLLQHQNHKPKEEK